MNTTKLTDEEAVVEVASRELAHYIHGGPVRPLPPRKALAIPLTERARRAGSPSLGNIKDLFLVKTKGRKPLLCTMEGKRLEAHYVLVKSVTHKGHQDKWPQGEIESGALAAMKAELGRQVGGR